MKTKDIWKVLILCTAGLLLFVTGYFLGRSSGTTVIYEKPAAAAAQQEQTEAVTDDGTVETEEAQAAETDVQQKQINLNTADQAQLETLPGIGPVIAQRIVEYRQTYGPFRTIDEIKDVSGIGDGIFEKIKEWITVEEAEERE